MEMSSFNSQEQDDSPSATRTPDTKSPGGWRAIKYILGNESFEKLASMSLIANIAVYLTTKYNMSYLFVANVVTIWGGSSNVASLGGAFLSDTYLGRFRTLLCGSISSFLGMGTIAMTASIPQLRPSKTCADESQDCPQPQSWQLAVLFMGLGLLSIGAGGIRPCNIAFGADQFDTKTARGRAQLESFFNWWYFSFTIALVIALTSVVYVQTNISWAAGFAIPTACLGLSIFIFLAGRHVYIYAKPEGSVFSDVAKVITAACRKSKVRITPDFPAPSFYDPPVTSNAVVKYPRTFWFMFLDRAAIITDLRELDSLGNPRSAWRLCSLQQVEQCKFLVAILPVWITAIGTFTTMDQMSTFGVLQALQMDRSIGPKFEFPAGWMTTIISLSIAAWIFTYERVYIPMAKKVISRSSSIDARFTIRQRINIGIVLSIVTMLVSGIVERHRRESALKHGSFVSPTSFALLVPQFTLTGFTEAFAAVSIMEFFTMQMPETMRTVAGAIYFLSLSVASYTGSLIVNVVHKVTVNGGKSPPWVGGRDLNKNKLDYYYYIFAGLGVVNLVYFNLLAKRYVFFGKKPAVSEEVQLKN